MLALEMLNYRASSILFCCMITIAIVLLDLLISAYMLDGLILRCRETLMFLHSDVKACLHQYNFACIFYWLDIYVLTVCSSSFLMCMFIWMHWTFACSNSSLIYMQPDGTFMLCHWPTMNIYYYSSLLLLLHAIFLFSVVILMQPDGTFMLC